MVLTFIPVAHELFLWRFWLSDRYAVFTAPIIKPCSWAKRDSDPNKHSLDDHRVHIYDVYDNELSETRRTPEQSRTVFQEFDTGTLDDSCRTALRTAELAFTRLESEAERVLDELISKIRAPEDASGYAKREIAIPRRSLNVIRKFFVFLRYRNSDEYAAHIASLDRRVRTDVGSVVSRPHGWHRIRRQALLGSFHAFLQHQPTDNRGHERFDGLDCWRFRNAEICFGLASEGQQYLLPDTCFGVLDEEFGGNPNCEHLFFPVMPTLALYILGSQDDDATLSCPANIETGVVWVDCGLEGPSDIHLRNAVVLQSYPKRLYFSSLYSITQSISSYDQFRTNSERMDYSRLKQRSRQKYTLEQVTKTLVVKGSILLVDLSEEVVRVGDSAVSHGSFSDVWKGVWTNYATDEARPVALKFLRRYMANDVREKVLRRLKSEIVAWHRLHHPNIAQLFGAIQSMNTIAMVSPWCNNGTIIHYLEKVNPHADRLALLLQIASGVGYLHNCKPIVVHGDLKGSNILIDDTGNPLITDFGLSNVVEELCDSINLGTSLFAGSTRYMAPELVLALVEDDGIPPPITTASDVYAFACVCLEVATGQVPYPHRSNDHAVTVDIMRGVKPSRGSSSFLQIKDHDAFGDLLDRCWDADWYMRPSMTEVTELLRGIAGSHS
ncbi:hypothetical protein SERLA73DRAFT_75104 [Serpula lacrymans var. lacrymans S7.3]|uniref:Protein kinase domain-containing protein n=2 Tax=Serpula lacrymans var. lacrymans TaxID=341189 RepID=F8Q2K8_SERL3|nr:uncharacterized protein SERLADRAFT_439771 [Serpula lacrymans var. lacrymans S7.9]EGN97419.1 hypothetical protein SERLA73DRAFT_75104 [Serpula lacrymans var. lacrymans S7.3]EGO23010.1 hypothetical protein SERLADRAFT_439771 [Serpula lacrymans var. lacrymans S7.9]